MELLQKENVQLDEILEENDIALEYKDGKEAIKNFFGPDKLEQLLSYLMVDHNNVNEVKKAYKFPQIAADILSSGTKQVLDFFMVKDQNEDLVNFLRLFEEFLDSSK